MHPIRDEHKKWYRVVTDHHPSGQRTPMWEIECRKCHSTHRFNPSGSEEQIRKGLIRQEWDLGRRPSQHLCPLCCTDVLTSMTSQQATAIGVAVDAVNIEPEPEPRPLLADFWDDATPVQQAEFLVWLRERDIYTHTPRVITVTDPAPAPPPQQLPPLVKQFEQLSEPAKTTFFRELGRSKIWAVIPEKILAWIWERTGTDQRDRFLEYLLAAERLDLRWLWNTSNPDQRDKFIGFLRTCGLKTGRMPSLVEHWRLCGEPERDRLRQELAKDQPKTEPPKRAKQKDDVFVPEWSDDEVKRKAAQLFGNQGG
jgi:hypothetical protein